MHKHINTIKKDNLRGHGERKLLYVLKGGVLHAFQLEVHGVGVSGLPHARAHVRDELKRRGHTEVRKG